MNRRTLPLIASFVVAALVPVAGSSARAAEGPHLESDPQAMEDALECPESFDDEDAREPLLLVHGTFATPEENWGWNYAAALPAEGWDVCTVRLPERSNVDIQVSSEYVVYAIRQIAARSGEPVDVMGHSQGGLQPRWAVKWWPDVAAAVDDLVMLATPNHGTVPADLAYEFGCFPACYQMASQSNFIAALNRDDETPGDISYTSIYSLTDELVQPAAPDPTAALDGAVNILVQEDLCPGRPVEHVQFAFDAAVHSMVIDALTSPGPADLTRFDTLTCAEIWFDGVDPSVFPTLISDNALTDALGGGESGGPGAEPPLKDYAQPPSGSSDDADVPEDSGAEGGDGHGGTAVAGAEAGRSSRGPLPATGGAPALLAALGLLSPAAILTGQRRRSA